MPTVDAPLVNQYVVGVFYDSPGIPNASGATAGSPGTWQPAGCEVPPTLQLLMQSAPPVVANPATAWTLGQYVQTLTPGAPGEATWTGTAWVGGRASLTSYDPSAHTVDDVKVYVTDHPEERGAILAAEETGKARTSLLDWLALT